jgi:hypothetical protein
VIGRGSGQQGEASKRKPARAAGIMQHQQSRGEDRHLQEKVWDPQGFQPRWKSHE